MDGMKTQEIQAAEAAMVSVGDKEKNLSDLQEKNFKRDLLKIANRTNKYANRAEEFTRRKL